MLLFDLITKTSTHTGSYLNNIQSCYQKNLIEVIYCILVHSIYIWESNHILWKPNLTQSTELDPNKECKKKNLGRGPMGPRFPPWSPPLAPNEKRPFPGPAAPGPDSGIWAGPPGGGLSRLTLHQGTTTPRLARPRTRFWDPGRPPRDGRPLLTSC